MEKSKIEQIAMAVAMVDYYNQIIENSKEEIRSLTEEEIEEINEGNLMFIKRQPYTKTTYSKEFNEELAKLKAKYPPTKETIENHTIKLQASSYVISKQKIIANNIANQNKTTLTTMKKVAASRIKHTK